MRSSLASILFIGLPLVLAAQAPGPDDPAMLAGQLSGDTYISATGLFRIALPVLPELGGTITDTPNVVTFADSFTTHLTIAVIPMDSTQRWELSTGSKKDYLVKLFSTFLLADFRQKFPGSTVDSATFLPKLQDGALLVYALLPGGSMFNQRIALFGASDNLPTAKRGNLLFVKGENIFILSSEIGERATERSLYTKTTAQEDEILRDRLLGMLGAIRFTGPAAATPAATPSTGK
jgi:hypothetical protein